MFPVDYVCVQKPLMPIPIESIVHELHVLLFHLTVPVALTILYWAQAKQIVVPLPQRLELYEGCVCTNIHKCIAEYVSVCLCLSYTYE